MRFLMRKMSSGQYGSIFWQLCRYGALALFLHKSRVVPGDACSFFCIELSSLCSEEQKFVDLKQFLSHFGHKADLSFRIS
jgi:hypothetical protein